MERQECSGNGDDEMWGFGIIRKSALSVDHAVTDQSSILRFIEDNWSLGRIGNGSADAIAGSLNGLFDFDDKGHSRKLLLDPATGGLLEGDSE